MTHHCSYHKIRIQQENNVTVLTLADPEAHNALSNELLEELCDALSCVSSTVLLLNAEGDHFSIGRPPQSY
ncbi:MAG: enoyl-CoA hydratase/isomerase family protein, partial [Thermomicrobium sp.]|uniref:enoyl-CoA hydratase-related protein n=1 Tax=Thermomicrobium sp. TaxID=1969469 RepID=UPI001B0C65B2